jgi:hypothetical protein
MAFECVQWIKRGGALPESVDLLTALTQTTYSFQGDKLLLEPKADLKAVGDHGRPEALLAEPLDGTRRT